MSKPIPHVSIWKTTIKDGKCVAYDHYSKKQVDMAERMPDGTTTALVRSAGDAELVSISEGKVAHKELVRRAQAHHDGEADHPIAHDWFLEKFPEGFP